MGFAAVDYLADVWLNDELLGHHEGYFAPFGFDVTDRLEKNNEVVVRVQDPLEPLDADAFFFEHKKRIIKGTLKYHDSRPGGLPGRMAHALAGDDSPAVWTPEWGQSMTTAGIVGPVTLTRTGQLGIDAAFVTPLDHETGRVQIAVVLTNHGDEPVDARVHLVTTAGPEAVDVTVPPGTGRIDAVDGPPRPPTLGAGALPVRVARRPRPHRDCGRGRAGHGPAHRHLRAPDRARRGG